MRIPDVLGRKSCVAVESPMVKPPLVLFGDGVLVGDPFGKNEFKPKPLLPEKHTNTSAVATQF